MNPNYSEFKFPQIKPALLSSLFKKKQGAPIEAVNLISKILVYNPETRLKPLAALQHPFFDDLRKESTKLPHNLDLPNLFNFTEEEKGSTTPEVIKSLIPSWYKEKKDYP
jgi:glycogen synthase kinase 3 beta